MSGESPNIRAIKFTFTLYDSNRRYFPDGKTYSYIVKLFLRTGRGNEPELMSLPIREPEEYG